ncbi:MAG: TSUP family transporter [bacterium]|nr:TSUP family transporter [bacterium]
MEIILICAFAAFSSLLTFYSGFGLGTILLPVFALFFPVEIAVGLTGIVHLLNNLFKLFLIGKFANKKVILKFGIPAVVGAFLGAQLLLLLSGVEAITSYELFNKTFYITPVKLAIAGLMISFAVFEIVPKFQAIEFSQNKLIVGGLLSGFFGGLSGHQGALRSAFLLKFGLGKEAFIATGVVIACLVDFTRISIYLTKFLSAEVLSNWLIILAATISAFIGAYFGNKLLKKVTFKFVQIVVLLLILVLGVLLGLGII